MRLQANVWRLYAITAAIDCLFVAPILALYYLDNGLSMRQVFAIRLLNSAIFLLLEVPSGFFADWIGRKASLTLGTATACLGLAAYAFSHGFWSLAGSQMLVAIGAVFISGANSALLFDSLKELSREQDYPQCEGRMNAASFLSEGAASLIGGALATISLRLVFAIQPFFTLAAVVLCLGLREPRSVEPKARPRLDSLRAAYSKVGAILRYALLQNRELRWTLLYGALIASTHGVVVWLIPPYLKSQGFSPSAIGAVWSALHLFTSALFLLSHRINASFGETFSLKLQFVFSVVGYSGITLLFDRTAVIFFFAIFAAQAISVPLIRNRINALVPSEMRATALSIYSLLGFIYFGIIGPAAGLVIDFGSLRQAFLLCTFIFSTLGLSLGLLAWRGPLDARKKALA